MNFDFHVTHRLSIIALIITCVFLKGYVHPCPSKESKHPLLPIFRKLIKYIKCDNILSF